MIGWFMNFIVGLRDKYLLRKNLQAGLQIGKSFKIAGKPSFSSTPCLVRIGNHVSISAGVAFITHDGATWVFREHPEYGKLQRIGTIDIKDNSYIGQNAVLLPDITIGPNAVVGAGAVVTKSVPANTVVGGCPARFISTYDEYVAKIVPKCWDCPEEIIDNPEKRREYFLAKLKEQRGDQIFEPPNKAWIKKP